MPLYIFFYQIQFFDALVINSTIEHNKLDIFKNTDKMPVLRW
ncbi:hypothetical protein ACN4EE_21890 [Geminocystis sp. CENA526]